MEKIDTDCLKKYVQVRIPFDLSKFSKEEKKALYKLREASDIMDELFLYQSSGKAYSEWKVDIDKINDQKLRSEYSLYFDINMGLYDRLDETSIQNKPKGANFYPSDMTIEEFNDWIKTLSNQDQEQVNSFYTIIRRNNQGKLEYVPYNIIYSKWLEKAAKLLKEASELVENKSLSKFLLSRSESFLNNNYYNSEIDWLKIENNIIDVTIGPYEVYEDRLLNKKSTFESFLCIKDKESTEKLLLLNHELQNLENNLPCDNKYKNNNIKSNNIIVVNEIYNSGDRGGPRTAAFNLPNDEKVIKDYGNKLVILKNIQEAKFNNILIPISNIVLDENQKKFLSFEAFFNHILCHEICHSLGPHILNNNNNNNHKTVREALGSLYSCIEECKADIAGLYSLLYLIEINKFNKNLYNYVLITYLASIFRSIRFGLEESHGKGTSIQLNWIIEHGGIYYNNQNETYSIVFDKIHDSITSLTKEILTIQGNGDKNHAQKLIDNYSHNRPYTEKILKKLQHIPVDIYPIFEWKD